MWHDDFAYQHEKFVGTKCADYKLGPGAEVEVEAVAELDMTDSAWLNQCQWQATVTLVRVSSALHRSPALCCVYNQACVCVCVKVAGVYQLIFCVLCRCKRYTVL